MRASGRTEITRQDVSRRSLNATPKAATVAALRWPRLNQQPAVSILPIGDRLCCRRTGQADRALFLGT